MNFYYRKSEELTQFMLAENWAVDDLEDMLVQRDDVKVDCVLDEYTFEYTECYDDDARFLFRFLNSGAARVGIGYEEVYEVVPPVAVLSGEDDAREFLFKGKLKLIGVGNETQG